jgi:hypothetical protein
MPSGFLRPPQKGWVYVAKLLKTTDFVTCSKSGFHLEMYSCAPINRADPPRTAVGRKVNQGVWKMVGMVARWGHNTLLIALALMTCVLFFAFK